VGRKKKREKDGKRKKKGRKKKGEGLTAKTNVVW